MHAIFLSSALSAIKEVVIAHGSSSTQGSVPMEPWQVINLVGTPMLALLFLPMAVDDLKAWFRQRQETH